MLTITLINLRSWVKRTLNLMSHPNEYLCSYARNYATPIGRWFGEGADAFRRTLCRTLSGTMDAAEEQKWERERERETGHQHPASSGWGGVAGRQDRCFAPADSRVFGRFLSFSSSFLPSFSPPPSFPFVPASNPLIVPGGAAWGPYLSAPPFRWSLPPNEQFQSGDRTDPMQ